MLLACSLAKAHNPKLDIRKPYSEIEGGDSYSGRNYDESYITSFRTKHTLPINVTTAFLTPGFRTKNIILTPDVDLKGDPPAMYEAVLQVLTDIQSNQVTASAVLAYILRCLVKMRDVQKKELQELVKKLAATKGERGHVPLSAEQIVTLIRQHIASPNSSRLPVLVVAAAYMAAASNLKEKVRPLQGHNAADVQTGALGDVEVTLENDDGVVTAYEMKAKRVTIDDLDAALEKILRHKEAGLNLDNYVFITTDVIEQTVADYALGLYEKSGGVEVVVLDCIGFLRHFLHLFHRLRVTFLDEYQKLVLEEPDSAVRQELKATFLTLRSAAETA
jgi:hypothetical protein